MGRYDFHSVGGAAGNAIQQFLLQRELQNRQRMLDEINAKNIAADNSRQDAAQQLQRDRFDAEERAQDEERRNRRAALVYATADPSQPLDAPAVTALRGTDYEALLDDKTTLPSRSMVGSLSGPALEPSADTSTPQPPPAVLALSQDAGGDAYTTLRPTAKQQREQGQRAALPGVMDLIRQKAPRADIAAGLMAAGQDVPASFLLGEDPADVEARRQRDELEQIHARGAEDRRTAAIRASNSGGGGIDYGAIADGIISGSQPPDVNTRSQYGMRLQSELAKRGFDLSTAVTDWRSTQRHFQTLNGPQQTRLRQAASTAYESLDTIDQLAAQWKGTGFPILNKVNLAAAKNGVYGQQAQSAAQQLDAQIADLTSELANVYMGGNSPTDHALTLAAKNLSADWSAKTLKDMTALARKNLQYRLNSIQQVGAITASNPTGGTQRPPVTLRDPQTGATRSVSPDDPLYARFIEAGAQVVK